MPSIIIPTKNRPRFLREAVASALAALPPGAGGVVVVDDRGEIPAATSLHDMADPRLRVLTNDGAPGPAASRNLGARAARAGIVMFLDDDDLMRPGYPAWVLATAEVSPAAGYGFSAIERFDDAEVAPPPPPFAPQPAVPVASLPFRRQIAGLGCGFWIQRHLFHEIGGIAEDILVNEDTEFTLRLLRRGVPGLWSPAAGVMVRTHGRAVRTDLGSLTRRTPPADRARYFEAILTRHADWLAGQPEARAHLLGRLLKMRAKTGNGAAAAAAIDRWGGGRLTWRLRYAAECLVAKARRG